MIANGTTLKLILIDGGKQVVRLGEEFDEKKVDPKQLALLIKKGRVIEKGKKLESPSNKKMPTASNKKTEKTTKKTTKKGAKLR